MDEIEKLLSLSNELLSVVGTLEIAGSSKLSNKIKSERKFLFKVKDKSLKIKENGLKTSNLNGLAEIVTRLKELPDVTGVLQPFSYDGVKVEIDIVSSKGTCWNKIISRNPKSLHMLCAGEGNFGQRSLLDQAYDIVECSKLHPVLYKQPEVTFYFTKGVSASVSDCLSDLGVKVEGKVVPDDELGVHATPIRKLTVSSPCSINSVGLNKMNLDVSTMLAYISALTNGNAHCEFKEPILNIQAEWERKKPLKPFLDNIFAGAELYCCTSAQQDFNSIVTTVGGYEEKLRANELLNRITVVPDQLSKNAERLTVGGRIKERSKVIFGTGDSMQAITISANSGFVRAALGQGVKFAVILHDSRALTESKQFINNC